MMAVSFVSVLHWPQLLALFGIGPSRPDWRIRCKSCPLPAGYAVAMLTAQVILEWLPYPEEFGRTLAAARKTQLRDVTEQVLHHATRSGGFQLAGTACHPAMHWALPNFT